jgi:hypothetical protein
VRSRPDFSSTFQWRRAGGTFRCRRTKWKAECAPTFSMETVAELTSQGLSVHDRRQTKRPYEERSQMGAEPATRAAFRQRASMTVQSRRSKRSRLGPAGEFPMKSRNSRSCGPTRVGIERNTRGLSDAP